MENAAEALEYLEEIEFAIHQDYEDDQPSVLEDIGYITDARRKQIDLRAEALSSILEIKKYFMAQRTLMPVKVDQLLAPVYDYFLNNGDQSFIINYILPFRIRYLP